MFFSEEKNQKTFKYCAGPGFSGHGSGADSESFLVLFFKKELLSS